MNSGPLLFLGIFAAMASSFWGLVLVPQLQLGRQDQVTNSATFALYPAPRGGEAKKGAEVYQSLGCVECHSQQVRGIGSDVARGWGARKTVAQDYLGDYPVLLGSQRIGPDLANIGLRQTSVPELLRHIYSPSMTAPGSIMPPYRFLFERRELKEGQKPAPEALAMEMGGGGPRWEVVPRPDAYALADYLLSLHADSPLYEAPIPGARTNAPPAISGTNAMSTNATSAATNTPDASNSVPAPPGAPAK
jgi:cytochrome c oxidase cbb3-type subunit 2